MRARFTAVMVALALIPAAARAQETASRYGQLDLFSGEVRAGKLSQADYDKLVAIRDQGFDRIEASAKRDAARSTFNTASLQTMMATVDAEMTDAVGSGSANAVLDASLSGNHAMTTGQTLPQIAEAGLVLTQLADLMRQLYTARAQMAGANMAEINRAQHTIDVGQAAIDAGLYTVRAKIEAGDAKAQTLPPAERNAVVARTDTALKTGAIRLGDNGKVAIDPALLKSAGFTVPAGSGQPGATPPKLGPATGKGSTGAVKPGGSAPGYDDPNSGNGQPPGYDTGKLPPREEIYRNVYDKNGNIIRSDDSRPILYDKNGDPYPNPDYNPELDAQVQRAQKAAAQAGQGGGGAEGGSGSGSGGSGGSTLYDPQGADYAALSSNGYSSVSLDTIYGQAQVIYGNGWSNTVPIPSTQVAGPTKVGDSPDTHPAGPSSGGLTGPSSAGLTGISSAGLTGPSSAGVTGISSGGLTGPSSAMTGPSSAGLTTPSSVMTGPSSAGLTTGSAALGNPDARADLDDDGSLPSLCGR